MSKNEKYDFMHEVLYEKSNILCNARKNPCEILLDVFDLCIDNFDGLNLEQNQPKLYSCLKQLYRANKEKPLIDSLKENSSTIRTLKEMCARQI